jgi:hypothetical protein
MAIQPNTWSKLWALVLSMSLVCGGILYIMKIHELKYTVEEMEFFKEIALKVEYGNGMDRIHKWVEEIKIRVIGKPTRSDLASLEDTINKLNSLSKDLHLQYALEDKEANVEIYFIPHTEFSNHDYVDKRILNTNWGLGVIWWNKIGEINKAVILIDTEHPNPTERAHLIREELTQCLGLLNDTLEDSRSIFYQGWGIQDYSEKDMRTIQMLYDRRIKPNMVEKEIKRVLSF